MKKIGFASLILLAFVLASCSNMSFTTGKICLNGARMAMGEAPMNVEKITAELKNKRTGETDVQERTVNPNLGSCDDITWDNLTPDEEYTISVTAEGSDGNSCSYIYKGSADCKVASGKMTYVKVPLKKAFEYSAGSIEDDFNSYNGEQNPIKDDTTGFTVRRDLNCSAWKVDGQDTFVFSNETINDYKELFKAYVGEAEASIISVEPADGFAWSTVGEGYCKVNASYNDNQYSMNYPIIHKYNMSGVKINPGNTTVNQKNPLTFTISSQSNVNVTVLTTSGSTRKLSFSNISQMAYSYSFDPSAGSKTGSAELGKTISLSLSDLGVTEDGNPKLQVRAKQIVDSEYSRYFYNAISTFLEINLSVSVL